MPTKYFVEKEINVDKLSSKEKDNYKDEKNEKSEKDTVKEHKDGKEHKDKDKDSKEHKEHREKAHKDSEVLPQTQPEDVKAAATPQFKAYDKLFYEKQTGVDKFVEGPRHKDYKAEVEGPQELFKNPRSEVKDLKVELKEGKHEIKEGKHEIKEFKYEIKEFKHEIKEFKHEKYEKIEYEHYPVGPIEPGGPVEAGSVGERLSALEAAMTQLLHFIPAELRPDLTQGALKQEPDTATKEATPKATETKPKS